MKPRRIIVSDLMQTNYAYWRTERPGRAMDPDLNAALAPAEMLRLGVFGGKYMTDCRAEFPASWFTNAKLSPARRDPLLNCFSVNASQSLACWRDKGWLHEDDPRGWFQWYCRYYSGRRHEDDERQIRRRKAMRRHLAQLRSHCEPLDMTCRRKQRQALLHWGYDTTLE
jgi:hypothetical protein